MQPYYSQELYHHGIKGMKWGVRRYQNSDGSLTNAGRARYAKIANASLTKQQKLQSNRLDNWNKSGRDPKYSNMSKKEEKLYNKYKDSIDKLDKDKHIRESSQNKKEPVTVNPPKVQTQQQTSQPSKPNTNAIRTKSVKDMSDEELNAIVNRMNLEQRYAQLNPAHVSRGKKITDAIIAKGSQEILNRASKVAGDMIERKLREMAGIQNQQKK